MKPVCMRREVAPVGAASPRPAPRSALARSLRAPAGAPTLRRGWLPVLEYARHRAMAKRLGVPAALSSRSQTYTSLYSSRRAAVAVRREWEMEGESAILILHGTCLLLHGHVLTF